MTPEDVISVLDTEIAYIKSRINSLSFNDERNIELQGNSLKNRIINALRKIGGRKSTLQAINNVSFESRFFGCFTSQLLGQREVGAGLEKCYRDGTNVIIDILQQERDHFIRIKLDQEKQKESAVQKKNNRIQMWTLITSVLAIILSAISLVFTIFS